MSKKRQYKQYTKEFKYEAVALVTEQGYSVPEAAKSLGVNPNLLYRWKDKAKKLNNRPRKTLNYQTSADKKSSAQ